MNVTSGQFNLRMSEENHFLYQNIYDVCLQSEDSNYQTLLEAKQKLEVEVSNH